MLITSFATEILHNLRLENPNRIMVGQLDINSIRNNFEKLTSVISDKLDVLLLSETKIDETFPSDQFLNPGFSKSIRLDRNSRDGGIRLLIRNNIPFKLIKNELVSSNTEAIFVEISLRKKK